MPSLKPSTYGTQYAGWTPSTLAMQGLGNRVLTDQRIPVAGAELHADVYLPTVEGRFPAVVSFSAYSTETHTAGIPTGSNEIGSPPVFTDRGYAPVIVERRGMGRSTGDQGMFLGEQDVDDHQAVIAWAAAQPWCNGEVVLFGTSYYGMTQPLVAVRKPPALKAFFGNEICTDYYRQLAQFGGVPNLGFFNVWMGANFTQEQYDKRWSPRKRAIVSHVTNGALHPLVEKAVRANVNRMFAKFTAATPVESVRRIYADWVFGSKTRDEPGTIPEGPTRILDRIEIPFAVVQNLAMFNLHQYGSYDLFENAATRADRKWLIVAEHEYDLPAYSFQLEAIAFYDHILRGTDNGYAQRPHVRYWVDGADRYEGATSFPPPGTTTIRLYPAKGPADHHTQPLATTPSQAGSGTWHAVPFGVPILGGIEEIANQLLSYEYAPSETVEFAGPVTANLRFSCNELDSFVIARLSRIDSAGKRHHLSMGVIRPAARTIEADRSTSVEIAIDTTVRTPLVPGEPVTLRFSLTPGPVRLEPGERLRLDIGSRTDLLRESPATGFAHFELPAPPYFSRNTLHYGGESWIELAQMP
ncbi:CocE/NonD family hydrolase [Leifsonia sp. NPDC058194]|uniref:CocE/NonD family hydrolase n=1 Tax=Leifsonia sp. NPDC058194 TaxID=3346374 RepID=UPI0036D8A6F4